MKKNEPKKSKKIYFPFILTMVFLYCFFIKPPKLWFLYAFLALIVDIYWNPFYIEKGEIEESKDE